MSKTWELQKGNILVVEDANTASLVIVVKDLKKKEDKIVALEEIIQKMRNDQKMSRLIKNYPNNCINSFASLTWTLLSSRQLCWRYAL